MADIDDLGLQDVYEHCHKCDMMKNALTTTNGDLEKIGNYRKRCMHCRGYKEPGSYRFSSRGIYKFDAIYTAIREKNKSIPNKNVGKKATIANRYRNVVKNLREEGKTLREIAKIAGISLDSVQKILKEKK